VTGIAAGVLLVSFGLEMFLSPHKIIPGGIKGIAILLSHMTETKMGLVLLFINLPFAVFPKRTWSKTLLSLASLVVIALLSVYLHPFPPLLLDPVPASILGGLIFGCGVGLIVRHGWYADGVNEVVLLLKRKIRLTIAELLMIINLTILALGGFLFGWDQALHSTIAYFLAMKAIQWTLKVGGHSIVKLNTDRKESMALLLAQEFQGSIQLWKPISTEPDPQQSDLYFILPSKSTGKMRELVMLHDPEAVLEVTAAPRSEAEKFYQL